MYRLTDAQAAALLAWSNLHGRFWKDRLRQAWGKSFYGILQDTHGGALQQLRNDAPTTINLISMRQVKLQVHAHDVRIAAQCLIDKLKTGEPLSGAASEFVRVEGLLQISPEHYEGGQ